MTTIDIFFRKRVPPVRSYSFIPQISFVNSQRIFYFKQIFLHKICKNILLNYVRIRSRKLFKKTLFSYWNIKFNRLRVILQLKDSLKHIYQTKSSRIAIIMTSSIILQAVAYFCPPCIWSRTHFHYYIGLYIYKSCTLYKLLYILIYYVKHDCNFQSF